MKKWRNALSLLNDTKDRQQKVGLTVAPAPGWYFALWADKTRPREWEEPMSYHERAHGMLEWPTVAQTSLLTLSLWSRGGLQDEPSPSIALDGNGKGVVGYSTTGLTTMRFEGRSRWAKVGTMTANYHSIVDSMQELVWSRSRRGHFRLWLSPANNIPRLLHQALKLTQ